MKGKGKYVCKKGEGVGGGLGCSALLRRCVYGVHPVVIRGARPEPIYSHENVHSRRQTHARTFSLSLSLHALARNV